MPFAFNPASSRICAMALIGFLFAGLAAAQHFEWVKPSLSPVPPGRCCGAMTYDVETRSTVLFGGGVSGVAFNDTWLFSRTQGWSQLTPAASPPPTSGPGFAYDPITKTAVLFGGNPGNFVYVNTTWLWDGTTWTQQFPPVSPSARAFNTQPMAFDAATGTVVLFGGFANGGRTVLGDTWVWNGPAKLWVKRFPATSPSPRATTVAYDGATKQVVIFGGDGLGGSFLADTWTWDGATWTQQFPASSPPARANHMMATGYPLDSPDPNL
jgi:Galactose oxidase, central domain